MPLTCVYAVRDGIAGHRRPLSVRALRHRSGAAHGRVRTAGVGALYRPQQERCVTAAGAVCEPQQERYTGRPACCMAADLGLQDACSRSSSLSPGPGSGSVMARSVGDAVVGGTRRSPRAGATARPRDRCPWPPSVRRDPCLRAVRARGGLVCQRGRRHSVRARRWGGDSGLFDRATFPWPRLTRLTSTYAIRGDVPGRCRPLYVHALRARRRLVHGRERTAWEEAVY
jgi:hypothetical protein